MSIPRNIDPEAIRVLKAEDWPWNDYEHAFVKAHNPERETLEQYRSRPPDQISYAELKDHGLTDSVTMEKRGAGLQWLQGRLSITNI